ncbi:kelch-like protein 25 [Achroia grisella]|uniref:kelch-like protein 25 n=1 Tax=Achroia grisella TaxID=688607 RepID=UPI0027D1F257|nr:kelch-like protein 25 [Achroia grisella]
MSQTKFTLSWDAYQTNFCTGLGSLQQNEEFVDMTLAADGHHVKVHQLVLSLVSPYLKALITSIQCPHPVIFLNNISYKTLCSILEYVYTGEVVVAQEDISNVIEAGKALKIKGLEDMMGSMNTSLVLPHISTNVKASDSANEDCDDKEMSEEETLLEETYEIEDKDSANEPSTFDSITSTSQEEKYYFKTPRKIDKKKGYNIKDGTLLYTLSNQGSLQLILNRFMYCLRYIGKRGKDNLAPRRWRCIDYNEVRCPASVITKDNVVVQRASAHIHPFHDSKILKKVRSGAVFTAIPEAEKKGEDLKKNRQTNMGPKTITEMEQDSE